MGGLYRPQNASVAIERLSNIQKMSKARGDPMIHDLEGKLRHGLFCFAIPIDGEGAILTRNIVPRPRLELIRARRPGLLLDERAEDRPALAQTTSGEISQGQPRIPANAREIEDKYGAPIEPGRRGPGNYWK